MKDWIARVKRFFCTHPNKTCRNAGDKCQRCGYVVTEDDINFWMIK